MITPPLRNQVARAIKDAAADPNSALSQAGVDLSPMGLNQATLGGSPEALVGQAEGAIFGAPGAPAPAAPKPPEQRDLGRELRAVVTAASAPPPADPPAPPEEAPIPPAAASPDSPSGQAPAAPVASADPAPSAAADVTTDPAPLPAPGAGVSAAPAEAKAAFDPAQYEMEPVEYEREDGSKVTVYTTKDAVEAIKDGYALKRSVQRQATYLGRHRPWLGKVIEDRAFEPVAPILQTYFQDPGFKSVVDRALDFAMRAYVAGVPLEKAMDLGAAAATPAEGAAPAAPTAAAEADPDLSNVDQFVLENMEPVLRARLKPLYDKLGSIDKVIDYIDRQAQESEASKAAQAAKAAEDYQTAVLASHIATRLSLEFPQEFSGDPRVDEARLQQLFVFGQQRGLLLQGEVPSPADFVAIKYRMDRERALGSGTAPAVPGAPPAPASPLAAVVERAKAAGGAAAAAVANRASGGGPGAAAPAAPPPKGPVVARTRDDQGNKLSVRQSVRETIPALLEQFNLAR